MRKIMKGLSFLSFLAPVVTLALSAPPVNNGHWDMLWAKIAAASFCFSMLVFAVTALSE